MNEFTIAELVKQTGIPAATIHYYENEGLIAAVGQKGSQRLFNLQVVEQLLLIRLSKQLGLGLSEMQNLMDRRQVVDQAKLEQRACDIDEQIQQLDILRQCLRHIIQCEDEHVLSCPTFQQLLKSVAFDVPKKNHHC